MKNADQMLKQIMDEVDTNKDGKIQYDGMLFAFFRICNYVTPTRQLHHGEIRCLHR